MNGTDALENAAPELVKKWQRKSITEKASKMAADSRIRTYLENAVKRRVERREITEDELLSRLEKRAYLAACVRDEQGEWPHRLAAIKVDNDMSGDALQRVEEELALGLILERLGNVPPIPTAAERAQLGEKTETIEMPPESVIPADVETFDTPQRKQVSGPYEQDFAELEPSRFPVMGGASSRQSRSPVVREYEE
ncbi:MAG TPA: hypothetical protein VFT72_01220 [Opitutaceae bacterium]|nr:hypothetical protein [Opitutaceae bacterium]